MLGPTRLGHPAGATGVGRRVSVREAVQVVIIIAGRPRGVVAVGNGRHVAVVGTTLLLEVRINALYHAVLIT